MTISKLNDVDDICTLVHVAVVIETDSGAEGAVGLGVGVGLSVGVGVGETPATVMATSLQTKSARRSIAQTTKR
jgi:hypothetical protein